MTSKVQTRHIKQLRQLSKQVLLDIEDVWSDVEELQACVMLLRRMIAIIKARRQDVISEIDCEHESEQSHFVWR